LPRTFDSYATLPARIADHSARPEDGTTVGKTYRQIAEQALRSEVEAAGFKFVADAQFLPLQLR
jgi:predicted methyltransferase